MKGNIDLRKFSHLVFLKKKNTKYNPIVSNEFNSRKNGYDLIYKFSKTSTRKAKIK